MSRVPYRGGAQVVQDLIPGRVQFYVSPTLALLPLLRDNQIKLIGISSPERMKEAPQVPTLREQGLDFVRFGWLGFCAGAGTPQPILELLNRHVAQAVQAPDYRQLIEKAGSVPLSSTRDELARILAETYEQTAATVREFGLQQD